MKKNLLLLIVTVMTGCVFENKVDKSYPISNINYTLISISNLKQSKVTSRNYNIYGYVVKIFTCPPCPKGMICKPCMGDNIVISEENELMDTYSLSKTDLIVFCNNPKQFKLGQKYKFSITITDRKSTNEPINDIRLIGYNSIK